MPGGSGEWARLCIHHPHNLSIRAKCRPGMSWMWDSGSFHVVRSRLSVEPASRCWGLQPEAGQGPGEQCSGCRGPGSQSWQHWLFFFFYYFLLENEVLFKAEK